MSILSAPVSGQRERETPLDEEPHILRCSARPGISAHTDKPHMQEVEPELILSAARAGRLHVDSYDACGE